MAYVEQFYDVEGRLRWRAVDPQTGRTAVAETREQALAALEGTGEGREPLRCPHCGGEMLRDALRQEFYCDACW